MLSRGRRAGENIPPDAGRAAPDRPWAIVSEKLCVSFRQRPVLRDLSLALPQPGLSVIAGRSGSGKTTFLRAVNRLNDELGAAVSGQLRLDFGAGLEPVYGPEARPVAEIRRLAGMVFQTPNVLPATIWKNMALPLSLLKGLKRDELEERVRRSLEAVGLWPEVADRLHHEARALSGGQRQRLCLARALALAPRVLLLDEPTASLDVLAAGRVEDCLHELARRYPLVVVSHSLAQAWRLSDRLYFFSRGRFAGLLRREEIASEQDLRHYLETLEE